MRWMNAGLTAAVLFTAPAFADDAQQTATTTMREAMAEQAAMPAAPHAKAGAPSSDAKPKADGQVKTMKHAPGTQHTLAADQAARLAHQHATVDATSRADSMHAAMANKAAMNAMSTSMMGGSTSGGSNTGGATPGTPGSTTGGSSTPMGGKH